MQDLPRIHVGLTRTINLGNYEKVEVTDIVVNRRVPEFLGVAPERDQGAFL